MFTEKQGNWLSGALWFVGIAMFVILDFGFGLPFAGRITCAVMMAIGSIIRVCFTAHIKSRLVVPAKFMALVTGLSFSLYFALSAVGLSVGLASIICACIFFVSFAATLVVLYYTDPESPRQQRACR